MRPKIILATTSPYRKVAFDMLGINYIAEPSGIEENFEDRPEDPEFLAGQLAKMKADAVAKNYKDGIVIGFDALGCLNGKILEKPESPEEAFQRLKSLSGNRFELYVGVYMINITGKKTLMKTVKTEALMRKLTDDEINRYLFSDTRVRTFALGFDPLETYSSAFIKEIKGSYNCITRGIPLETVVEMLYEIGYMEG